MYGITFSQIKFVKCLINSILRKFMNSFYASSSFNAEERIFEQKLLSTYAAVLGLPETSLNSFLAWFASSVRMEFSFFTCRWRNVLGCGKSTNSNNQRNTISHIRIFIYWCMNKFYETRRLVTFIFIKHLHF